MKKLRTKIKLAILFTFIALILLIVGTIEYHRLYLISAIIWVITSYIILWTDRKNIMKDYKERLKKKK